MVRGFKNTHSLHKEKLITFHRITETGNKLFPILALKTSQKQISWNHIKQTIPVVKSSIEYCFEFEDRGLLVNSQHLIFLWICEDSDSMRGVRVKRALMVSVFAVKMKRVYLAADSGPLIYISYKCFMKERRRRDCGWVFPFAPSSVIGFK